MKKYKNTLSHKKKYQKYNKKITKKQYCKKILYVKFYVKTAKY